MNKSKYSRLRLSLLFALIVFFVMLFTIITVFCLLGIAVHFEIFHITLSPIYLLMYFALVSLVMGTIIAFCLSGKPLKPLREIMNAVDRIAQGDYSARLNFKRPEEFKQLGQKFNHMAEELSSVEMLRSDFVSNFSHEFKTPINSISGFAKILKWEDLSEEERNEYLDIIIHESERLSVLATNTLYLSRLESQSAPVTTKSFNISEQIRQVILLLDQKFTAKNLDVSLCADEFFVCGNEEMMKQVWINLLDNAIKFTPDGKSISITLNSTSDNLCAAIQNDCEGLSDTAIRHLFDKYYQADTSHTTPGNGLGLSIVKRIVDMHGGKIEVESTESSVIFKIFIST